MSEKEKRITELFAQVVKGASEPTKSYLMGWVECAASVVCNPALTAEQAEA